MASEKENEEVPISALEELLQLQADGDTLVIKAADGTTKQMRASILCWELVELLCAGDNYRNRNNILREKDLTGVYTVDELYNKVHSGDFSNLFIADYITVSITTSLGGTEDVDLMVGCFDYFYHGCNPELDDHHLLMVTREEFKEAAQMNSSNTTEGGLVGSAMFTDVLPVYAEALKTALNGHILNHYRYLTTEVNTSAPSAAGANYTGSATTSAWTPVDICLMSESMVYGGPAAGSSFRDVGDACIQLPLFRMCPDYRIAHAGKGSSTRRAFWLCGVASSTRFCGASYDGVANNNNASDSNGVRPYFLFG